MRDEEIKVCPFRVMTETFPAMLVGNGDIVRASFEPCLKESCPAFYVARGGYGQEYERCRRLYTK